MKHPPESTLHYAAHWLLAAAVLFVFGILWTVAELALFS
jgi:hypothetical protein